MLKYKLITVIAFYSVTVALCPVFTSRYFAYGEDINMIVYTSFYEKDDTVYSNLYSMNPDGSAKTQITDFYPYSAREPEFSPDGKHLVFTSNLASFKSANYEDIFRLDLTIPALIRVTGAEYLSTSVKKTGTVKITAPDDTGLDLANNMSSLWISFQGCENVISMTDYEKAGGLINVPATIVWVKIVKNKWIGCIDYEVRVPAGGSVLAEPGNLSSGNVMATQPSWSSDGTRIAGVSGLAYYDTDAFNKDGTLKDGRSQYGGIDTIGVWDINGLSVDYLEASPATLGTNIQPRFSPDGAKLAYCKGPFPTQSIVVVPGDNLNGTETMVAQGGTDFTTLQSYGYLDSDWSPDGTQIACTYAVYDTSLNITGNIVIADSSGSGQITQITNLPQNSAAGGVDFSPDGQWVAYTVMTSKSGMLNYLDLALFNFTADIYIQNLATGEQLKITDDGASADPSWAFASAQPTIPSIATTTTVPGGSGTTTVNGGNPGESQCPFSVSLNNHADVVMIRQLRNHIKEKDEFLVDVFYEHSAEVALLLNNNSELKFELQTLTRKNMALVKSLIKTGTATVSTVQVKKITEFMRHLSNLSGGNLQDALDMLISDIENGDILKRLGAFVEKPAGLEQNNKCR